MTRGKGSSDMIIWIREDYELTLKIHAMIPSATVFFFIF